MTYRLEKSPQADIDTDKAFEYLAERSVPTAIRFLDKVAVTMERLREDPSLGMHLKVEEPGLQGIFWRRVDGFPNHLIFFRVDGDLVFVVRVLHGARDWKSELDGQ